MTNRETRTGAVIAGATLLAMPAADLALGTGMPGLVHLVVGMLGAALFAAGLSGRLL